LILLTFIQSNAITDVANLAIDIVARLPVIDPVAVANVEAELGAVPPYGVLYEPRENGREGRIEGPGVDLLGHQGNNVGATVWPVAASAIEMVGAEPGQDPGAVQKHGGADLPPSLITPRAASRTHDNVMVSTLSDTP
jgi:hypothetical protein